MLLAVWLGLIICVYLLDKALFSNIEILLFRIPIFILGLFFANKIMQNQKVSKTEMFILVVIVVLKLFCIKTSMMPIFGRVMATFWSFPIMFMGTWLCTKAITKSVKFDKFIQWTGAMSLELYIVHVSLREMFNAYNFSMAVGWHYVIMVIVTYVIAILLKKLNMIWR